MTKTEWFPAHVKPVREGWYEVKECDGFLQCGGLHYWAWCLGWLLDDPNGRWAKSVQNLPWRGLKEEVK